MGDGPDDGDVQTFAVLSWRIPHNFGTVGGLGVALWAVDGLGGGTALKGFAGGEGGRRV